MIDLIVRLKPKKGNLFYSNLQLKLEAIELPQALPCGYEKLIKQNMALPNKLK